jgi:hypothetical protein
MIDQEILAGELGIEQSIGIMKHIMDQYAFATLLSGAD